MLTGFAMVAYAAEHGETGVMTVLVSHNGKVYERDLGKESTAIGARMTTFDPGAGWKEVDPGSVKVSGRRRWAKLAGA